MLSFGCLAYFLSVAARPGEIAPGVGGPNASLPSITLRLSSDGSKLFDVAPEADLFPAGWNPTQERGDLTLEKRILFIPRANMLIMIPSSGDRLILKRLDIDKLLKELGNDYLFVVSPGSISGKPGQKLEHQVTARSKTGKVQFTVADGPEGVKLSPEGKFSFTIPPNTISGTQLKVVVTATDVAGLERFHKLVIHVR